MAGHIQARFMVVQHCTATVRAEIPPHACASFFFFPIRPNACAAFLTNHVEIDTVKPV
jgi:hypothetical protein